MAAVSEGVNASQSVLDFVSQMYDRFTASDRYKSEAVILNAKLDSLKQDDRIQLLPESGITRQTLMKAETALKTARARLNSLEERVDSSQSCLQCIWWLYAKVALALCPLENALKKVDEDLDNIPKLLKEENESEDGRRKADMSTHVHDNNKYVPIEESQRKVIEAIEDSDGPPLILLHGGVGKGKSTLARYMCKCYGKSGQKSNVFDHVIVVSCGNSSMSDSATKQYEILDNFSVTSLTDERSLKYEKAESGKNIDPKSRIEEALQKYLLHKKILMVLDDVSDPSFLSKMWMAARDGKDDKILITSQKSNLCDAFPGDFVPILMANPTGGEARRILASLVGLENKSIPRHLLGIANKMIKATDGNPLALGCLATAFSFGKDKKGKNEWQDAWKELSMQLGNTETSFVLGQNDGIAPSRSLWGAMKLCIDSLETEDARQTLLLTYACKGGSVPEGVLRILCAGLQMSSTIFNKSRDELLMRELLKHPADMLTSKMNLGKELNDEELEASPTWSLQSLVKLYMQWDVAGKTEMTAMFRTLLGDDKSSITCKQAYATEIVEIETELVDSDDETRVRIALCALYFDRHHTDQVVTGAATEACRMSKIDFDDSINDLRRKAIEPLVWLLDKREEQLGEELGEEFDEELGEGAGEESDEEVREEWTEEDKCRVRKVILQYICKRQLDAKNVSYLLKLVACPSAQLATLQALSHMASIEETPLLNENTISFLPAVVDLLNLKEGFHTSVQEAASEALSDICWKTAYDKSPIPVANLSGILEVLIQSLAVPKSDVFAENAAHALMGLAFSWDEAILHLITNKQGILASLVNCLYEHSKPRLQYRAAGALGNLSKSINQSLKLRIVSEEGALVGLVNCLSKHDKDKLQEAAARALANLAAAKDESLKLRIATEEEALVGLVNCLSKHDKHEVQEQAAHALGNLARTENESLKLRIANEEGALVGLVNCLSKHDKHEVQEQATRALGNLARTKDESLKLRIASAEGALVTLVNCLSKHDKDELQEAAAGALANLAAAKDESLQLRIATEEGALVGLVNCLSKHDKDKLQEAAACALANLAAAKDESLKLRIVSEEGALVGLVNCLSKHENDQLQEAAACALANLAAAKDESLKLRIASEEGALVGLVNCLSKHDKHEVQEQAARALANLARTKDESLKLRIASEEGALVGLVNCFSKHDKHEIQEQAARALGNLARTKDESLKLRIANAEGALVALVNCLSKHDKDKLQEAAAGALANLAAAKDESLKLRIASEEGALIGLVNCLSKHDKEQLQAAATGALANLAAAKDESLQLRIANEEGALVGLVNCLSKHDKDQLQAAAACTLANLAAAKDESLQLRITSEEGALVGLVNCLSKHDKDQLQEAAACALANLTAAKDESLKLRIASEEGALVGLVNCFSKHDKDNLQEAAGGALANLAAAKDESLKLRIASEEGALVGLVNCLSQFENHVVQTEAARMAAILTSTPDVRGVLRGAKGLVQGLTSLLGDDMHPDTRRFAVRALLNMDPTIAKELGLLSAQLDVSTLSLRICVKAKLEDFQGALDDANEAVKRSDTVTDGMKAFILQERGVLKRMMGDLEGALIDLDEGLNLKANDYERLKHRGYVKFLLNDVEGARADAEWALSIESSRDDSDTYLGGTSAEYLGYKL